MTKGTTPLKIIVKGVDIEISKEQAIRSGLLKNLFEIRNVFAPGSKFMDAPKEEIPSDLDSITIKIPSIEIIGKGGARE